jgi:PKD repeat protein
VNTDAFAAFPVRSGNVIGNIPTPNPNATPSPTPSPSPTATPSGPTPTPSPTPNGPTPTPTANPCQAPIAGFSATPTSGQVPLTVTFTDTSQPIGCAITSWAWDFDRNGTIDSTVPNPVHTFTARGNYDVRLTVTSAGGSNSTLVNNYIHVTN